MEEFSILSVQEILLLQWGSRVVTTTLELSLGAKLSTPGLFPFHTKAEPGV